MDDMNKGIKQSPFLCVNFVKSTSISWCLFHYILKFFNFLSRNLSYTGDYLRKSRMLSILIYFLAAVNDVFLFAFLMVILETLITDSMDKILTIFVSVTHFLTLILFLTWTYMYLYEQSNISSTEIWLFQCDHFLIKLDVW